MKTIEEHLTDVPAQATEAAAVVVGIDAVGSSQAAVAYALVEATAEYRPLRLVAVLENGALPPRHPGSGDDRAAWAELEQLVAQAHSDYPHTIVRPELHVGQAPERLAELSRDAHVLVVGRRDVGTVTRLLTGSTSTAVVGRTGVPVIVVPPDWVGVDHVGETVVVGLDGGDDQEHLLRFAFRQASRRHAPLTVVHAVEEHLHPHLGPEAAAVGFQTFVARGLSALNAQVAEMHHLHPLLRVEVIHTVGLAEDVLLEASHDAQLLILGRRAQGVFGVPLGSCIRTALAGAGVPVAVVPLATPGGVDEEGRS